MYQPLTTAHSARDRHTDAEGTQFEWEESHCLWPVTKHRDASLAPQSADGEGELRGQERIGQCKLGPLKTSPAG